MSIRKHLKDITAMLSEIGLAESRIEKGTKHVKIHIVGPHGARQFSTSSTPSDFRTLQNLRSSLRKVGREVGAISA